MPVITSGGIWTAITGGGELIVTGQDIIKVVHAGGTTTLEGADATGDDLKIDANQTDLYPYMKLLGGGDIEIHGGVNGEALFYHGLTSIGKISATGGYPHIAIKETGTSPSTDSGYGLLYTKSDNKLYFRDGDGTEHEVSFV